MVSEVRDRWAADLAQDVFLKASSSGLVPGIVAILDLAVHDRRNESVNRARRAAPAMEDPEVLADVATLEASPEEAAERGERGSRLREFPSKTLDQTERVVHASFWRGDAARRRDTAARARQHQRGKGVYRQRLEAAKAAKRLPGRGEALNSNTDYAARQTLKAIVEPTPDCISMDRFAEGLTPADRDHLADCARCQAEAAVWNGASDAAPRPGEAAAVQWIVEELRRRNQRPAPAPHAAGIGRWLSWRPLSALAAGVALVVTLGYLTRDREPAVSGTGAGPETYRSAQLQVRAPIGDQPAAPRQLEWGTVPGAVGYDVSILEVDRTVLWTGTTTEPRLALPAAVAGRLVPGKTVLWEVAARDASGRRLAVSGTQSFRVATAR